jgi:hypothetical protein
MKLNTEPAVSMRIRISLKVVSCGQWNAET